MLGLVLVADAGGGDKNPDVAVAQTATVPTAALMR